MTFSGGHNGLVRRFSLLSRTSTSLAERSCKVIPCRQDHRVKQHEGSSWTERWPDLEQLSVEHIICTFQQCRKRKKLEGAKYVQVLLWNNMLDDQRALGNFVVPMFVECGSVPDAQHAFNLLINRNEHSWTSLIFGYVECGQSQQALSLYQRMLADCVQPSSYTLMALVRASTSLKDVELGRWIHTEINCKGFGKEPFLGNILIHMYNKCGSLADARNVFDKLPVRDVVAWSALIGAYAENGLAKEALECFEGMQLEDVSPNAVTFVSSLKTCGNLAAINKGREIHSQLVQEGFETNPLIGNTLLDMYVKCGSFLEAQDVFNMLPVRDLVSWNTLIAGYAENGFGLEALRHYEEMQIEGMRPDAITFVSSLKSCGCLVAIGKGREIQALILRKGFDRDLFVGNALIGMYAKCGSLFEAQKVFDNLPVQDVVSWNALILGYAENGLSQEVVKFLDQMQLQNVVPNTVTFISILKACGSLGDVDRGREVHLKIADRGLENDVVVGSALVDMYSKCCSLAESQSVFENLLIRDDISWSALIAGYAEHGFPEEALKCFGEMILNGVSLTAVAYVSGLKACGIIGAIGKGRQIHTDIVQRGLENDPFLGSALVHMYAKCGMVTEAQKVFDMLPFRDVVSWTTLIAGYVENGLPEEALRSFDQMHGEGVTPDAFTFVCSLKACSNMFAIDKGKEIHHEIVQKGFQGDLFIGSSLVDMYSKFGCLSEARKVFDKLPVRNVVAWTTLIAGYADHGYGKEALSCFQQMQLDGIPPNAVTFICCLKACSIIGAIDVGRELHTKIREMQVEGDLFVGNTLIDMYAKCGAFAEAREVFDKLQVRDIVSWNALISGYAENGFGQEALECIDLMQLAGLSSNAITFVSSLKACGSLGAIDKGRKIHIKIIQNGLEKDLTIGNALIDMYVRCGSIVEAQELFARMPTRDVISWTAMIRGYGMNHDGYMAILYFENMQEDGVIPDAVTFICLLTVCSRAGLVLKGQEYFRMMIEQFGITPTLDHYNCMVDLLGRAGCLYEAFSLMEATVHLPSKDAWIALLSACKTYKETELGFRTFQKLIQLDPEHAASYVLMENLYDCCQVE